jgi:hypothetical protein
MKQFDTIIIHFGGLNRCQWHIFLLLSESGYLSLLFQPGIKKITKIKIYTKIELEKYQGIKII